MKYYLEVYVGNSKRTETALRIAELVRLMGMPVEVRDHYHDGFLCYRYDMETIDGKIVIPYVAGCRYETTELEPLRFNKED